MNLMFDFEGVGFDDGVGRLKHNKRVKGFFSLENIDPSLTHLNVDLGSEIDLKKIEDLLYYDTNKKTNFFTTGCIQIGSHEDHLTREEVISFSKDSKEGLKEKFPKNDFDFKIHFDEPDGTPQLQVVMSNVINGEFVSYETQKERGEKIQLGKLKQIYFFQLKRELMASEPIFVGDFEKGLKKELEDIKKSLEKKGADGPYDHFIELMKPEFQRKGLSGPLKQDFFEEKNFDPNLPKIGEMYSFGFEGLTRKQVQDKSTKLQLDFYNEVAKKYGCKEPQARGKGKVRLVEFKLKKLNEEIDKKLHQLKSTPSLKELEKRLIEEFEKEKRDLKFKYQDMVAQLDIPDEEKIEKLKEFKKEWGK